eukprot:3454824-Pleurochrysis_carterae.AAC.2
MEAMATEAATHPAADEVGAVRRFVSNPSYGEAAWAAIFGKDDKYVNTMPGEVAVPATAVAARQRLLRMLQRLVEAAAGEKRLTPPVMGEAERLAKSDRARCGARAGGEAAAAAATEPGGDGRGTYDGR